MKKYLTTHYFCMALLKLSKVGESNIHRSDPDGSSHGFGSSLEGNQF